MVTSEVGYLWRRKYAGTGKPEAKRLRELEQENARLKKLLAEQAIDNDILREVARGKFRRAILLRQPGAQAGGRRPCPARVRREPCLRWRKERRACRVVVLSPMSRHVVDTLDRLVSERGAPSFVRSDSTHQWWVGGGEFAAHRVAGYLHDSGSNAEHVDPGALWQNGYSKSFDSRLRDENLLPRRRSQARSSSVRWPRPMCLRSAGDATPTSRDRPPASAGRSALG